MVGHVQSAILEFLDKVKLASTRRIAKAIGKNYGMTVFRLLLLKDKGLVKDVRCKEKFPSGLSWLEVRYWYLPKYEKEVMEWLRQNSHILPLKKQKS